MSVVNYRNTLSTTAEEGDGDKRPVAKIQVTCYFLTG